MKYDLEVKDNIIIVSEALNGQFSTIAKLKEQVLHLLKSYTIGDVKLNNKDGISLDFQTLDDLALSKLINHKPIQCPKCLSNMTPGRCYTKSTLKGFLLWGFSSKELVFEDSTLEISTIIENGHQNKAYRCTKCEITLIQN